MSTDFTGLLPPITGVRLVWAMTRGLTSSDPKPGADAADELLKGILTQAEKDTREQEYVTGADAAMQASLRNLQTIYNGRNADFAENDKLRMVLLEQVKQNIDFGSKAKDLLTSLPSMTIGGAGGVALVQIFRWPAWLFWVLGLGLAAAGYVVNLVVVHCAYRQKLRQLMMQDYEHTVYYEYYLDRTVRSLAALYADLGRIHERVFGRPYDQDRTPAEELVRTTLKGIEPVSCPKVHGHMRAGIIKPDRWCQCETRIPDPERACDEWQKPARTRRWCGHLR